MRDSSGISIVENSRPAWTPGDAWLLADAPHVDIGGRDGEPGHDLHEVAGAVRLADGRIVAANEGSLELRFFSADGALLHRAGRGGEGPGEFRSIGRLLLLSADSLLVTDPSLNRLTVFDRSGTYARAATLQPVRGDGAYNPVALLSDGTLLARPGFSFGTRSQTGIHRDTILLVRYATDGTLADTVSRIPDSEFFVLNENGQSLAGLRTWGLVTLIAPASDGFAFGTGEHFALEYRDASGAIRQITRAALPPHDVNERDIARSNALPPDIDPGTADLIRRLRQAIPLPSRFPAWDALLTDANDHLWAREYQPWPEDHAQARWQVFDSRGRWLGAVGIPGPLRVMQILEDEVLGVFSDSLDVEHVQVYRLDRGVRR